MKRGVACLLGLILSAISWNAFAQEVSPDIQSALFLPIGQSVTATAGTPIILTAPAAKKQFVPQPVSWRPELPMVQISSFGGQTYEVPYVTHIPSYFIYVQVLPDKTAVVSERITLILSHPQQTPFISSLPVSFVDKTGRSYTQIPTFLGASYNQKQAMPQVRVQGNEAELVFFDGEGLPSGVHLFEMSYLIPNAIQQNGNVTRLFLPLLGSANPYWTERLQVLVTYPEGSTLSKAEVFYGKNNQEVPNAADIYIDENGRLIFKINGLLPPLADVRLDITGDAKSFVAAAKADKINTDLDKYAWLIVAVLGALVVFLYFWFTAQDVADKTQDKNYIHKVRARLSYDVGLLRWFASHKADSRTLLAYVVHFVQKGFMKVQITPDKNVVLQLQPSAKKAPRFEREVLHFIFPFFKKERSLKAWDFGAKTSHRLTLLMRRGVRLQMLPAIKREVGVGLALSVLSMGIIIYLMPGLEQFFLGSLIILVAFFVSLLHFIKTCKVDILLARLFREYSQVDLRPERRREADIALDVGDCTMDFGLNLEWNGEKLPLKFFEKMFLTQLKYERENKK